jgi:hypothetical protein
MIKSVAPLSGERVTHVIRPSAVIQLRADPVANVFEETTQTTKFDIVTFHHGLDDGIGEGVLESRFAREPIHRILPCYLCPAVTLPSRWGGD